LRIFKTKWTARFARREGIGNASLCEAIERAERGIIDADLGGGLIKQRVGRKGQGRSGGFRMLLAYQIADRAVFLYGFAKNERENISSDELAVLKQVAAMWLSADEARVALGLTEGEIQEVDDDDEET